MPIRQQIDAILHNRRQFQNEFVSDYEQVKRMQEFVNGVKAFKHNPGWLAMISDNDKLKIAWDSLLENVMRLETTLNNLCCGEDGSLMECLKRVKRDYLNIGCIGPWRQGKSTVISKLTNLNDYVIPTSKYLTCTGTTINVFNGNQVVWENGDYIERDGNKAVVYFHSFNSICKTINDYLKVLHLSPMPYASSQETFIQNCTKCFNEINGRAVADPELKKMLDNYLQHASEYASLIKQAEGQFDEILSISNIESQRKLKPLVSYYEYTDEEYADKGILNPERVYYVLAVKKVDVYTNFLIYGEEGPEEVGKIQFVDTPGLGESKLEVAETLSRTLKSDLDIAICLRKVSNQAGIVPTDSFDFHRILKQNTFGRLPENWVFYLYNKEGDISDNLLQATFQTINQDLSTTIVEGIERGQSVGGINLRYDQFNPQGNHIDFINAKEEDSKLQAFFLSILMEMVGTIADSDNAFYCEARNEFETASTLYKGILSGTLKTVSQCLPTFDDREKIINTIKSVKDEWNETVQCPTTLNDCINQALAKFYNESYGVTLASVLGVPQEQIAKMDAEIQKVFNAKELTVKARLENQQKITHDTLLPYIQKKITENAVNTKDVNTIFDGWNQILTTKMVNKALSLIEETDAIQQMDGVKNILWRGLMDKGKLGFDKKDEGEWLDHLIKLLEEGGNDFAALHDAIVAFRNYQFDLKGVISEFVRSSINEVLARYGILQGDGHRLEDIQESVYKTLIMSESETKAKIQTQCKSTVDSQLSMALHNFIDKVNQFEMQIIPSGAPFLSYNYEFEQLVRFYNKYSSEVFSLDEMASQKLAVQEWNVLKQKLAN